ncbi:hypothetical protein HY385_02120 [Candidatus Daviesbacteria bacterium]|nr:hypothetical protein [Candidatus Daviesbacteria bacterium]
MEIIKCRPFLLEVGHKELDHCGSDTLKILGINPYNLGWLSETEIAMIGREMADEGVTVDDYFNEVLRRVFGINTELLHPSLQRAITTTLMDYFPTINIPFGIQDLRSIFQQGLGDLKDGWDDSFDYSNA